MRRRRYLALVAASGLAGCLGLGDDGTTDGTDANDGTGETDTEDDEERDDNGEDGDDNGEDGNDEPPGVSLDQRWSEQLDVAPVNLDADMAIGDRAVFVGHDSGLVALELEDGSERWLREEFSEFTAVHADGSGVAALADGDVFEVASDTGETRFREPVEGTLSGFTRGGLTADLVFVSTDEGTTVYQRDSGDVINHYDTIQSDIITGEETTVLAPAFEAIGVDSATGEERWRVESGIGPGGASEDGALVGVGTGTLETGTAYGHDTTDGELQWEEPITHESTGFVDVAITEGVAVFVPTGEGDDILHAFDSGDGTEKWTENLGELANPFSPPAVADGVVVTEAETEIRALDAETGETLATRDRPFSIRAAVAGEGVFVQWASEDVTAYEL